MIRLEIKNCNIILTEKQKILALSSGKSDKYEYVTGEEMLSSNQKKTIEQAKFTYPSLRKAFVKQTKKFKEQRRKQIDAITNQNKTSGLNNKDDHKNDHKHIYKKIFDKIVK